MFVITLSYIVVMVVGFITAYAIMPITTNVVSSNLIQAGCTRYKII